MVYLYCMRLLKQNLLFIQSRLSELFAPKGQHLLYLVLKGVAVIIFVSFDLIFLTRLILPFMLHILPFPRVNPTKAVIPTLPAVPDIPTATPIPSPTVILLPPTSSKDQSARWNTYEDKDYGVSIQYPSYWYAYNPTFAQGGSWPVVTFTDTPHHNPWPDTENGPDKSQIVKFWYGNPGKLPLGDGLNVQKKQSVNVNGYKGLRIKQGSIFGLEDLVFLQNPKGGFVEIERVLNAKEEFEKIVLSFKFLQ